VLETDGDRIVVLMTGHKCGHRLIQSADCLFGL